MSEGKRLEEHVQISERRTHCITDAERGGDATADQPTHGDADAVCIQPPCSETVQVLMIINELSCRSPWHRRGV